ncbi:glycosyltransferase [Bacillus cereus group sp. MYBK234-1]|uniref:glycosyltransferase n=1 Tax=unclassified Bacillus cereus group TaxID=2750818 RepID=UPI003F78DCC3
MSFPSISLCMIVKDEEHCIEECLKHVCDLVDEIIIVDLGSSDNTINICKKYTKNVYCKTWDNHFAEARNFGIEKATKDWIFYLDADEVIEKIKPTSLKILLKKTQATIINLPILNYVGENLADYNQIFFSYQTRIFKNGIGIKFQNRLHETLCVPCEILESDIETFKINIHHFGYLKQVVKLKKKNKRNTELLIAEIRNPNPWIDYHIGSELYREKFYNFALYFLNLTILKFIKNNIKPPSLIYRLKYNIYFDAGFIEGIYPNIEKAILLYPDYVDLYYYKGLSLFQLKNYTEALKAFEICLNLGEENPEYLILKGVGSFRALEYVNMCLKKIKES